MFNSIKIVTRERVYIFSFVQNAEAIRLRTLGWSFTPLNVKERGEKKKLQGDISRAHIIPNGDVFFSRCHESVLVFVCMCVWVYVQKAF